MTLSRIITSVALSLSLASAAHASGSWVYHPTFNGTPYRIFDTSNSVYLLSRPQEYLPQYEDTQRSLACLYAFDKESEELRFLGRNAGLDSDLISIAEYNPSGKYLLMVYENFIIELLHDNGDKVTIPGLSVATGVNAKTVNGISFDPELHRAYLATDFGFLVIDDEDGEIESSHIYGKKLTDVARVGEWFVVCDDEGKLYRAPANRNLLQWNDYEPLDNEKAATRLLPVSDTVLHYTCLDKGTQLYTVDLSGPIPQISYNRYLAPSPYISVHPEGYLITGAPRITLLSKDGFRNIPVRDEEANVAAASLDLKTFQFAPAGEGFYTMRADDDSGATEWTMTRGMVRPEGPEPFQATYVEWLPEYGFMVPNHGLNRVTFTAVNPATSLQLSGLKDGSWSQYGFAARNPEQLPAISHPDGLAVDPDNPSLVYFGSRYSGMLRVNLEDPKDVLHMSRADDAWKNLPGFVEVHPVITDWKRLSSFVAPKFDREGNMWTVFQQYSKTTPEMEIWVWPAENRRASRNAASFRPFTKIKANELGSSSSAVILPLTHPSNANLVVATDQLYGGAILVLDHKGTLSNVSDDNKTVLTMTEIHDVEGQAVDSQYAITLFEDPESGRVWVGTNQGLFSFNPRTALQGSPQVQQFKVARNDGTSLADYLLSGIQINNITSDSRGRKWISTMGAGLVCVSSDGREVILTQTTSNSDIPSDQVFSACVSPETGTIMVATDNGIAEYRPYSVGDGTDFESARAYPNPVRPEYLGYVTIDGLADGAIVKIIDARGRLVRELGFAANGEVQWDVADMNHKRVSSGVYFVLASSGPGDESLSKATKILVVN